MFTDRELNEFALRVKSIDIETRFIPTHIVVDFTDIYGVEIEELSSTGINAGIVIGVFAAIPFNSNSDHDITEIILNNIGISRDYQNVTTEYLNAIEEYIEFLMEEYYSILNYNLKRLNIEDIEYLFLSWISPGVAILEVYEEYVYVE